MAVCATVALWVEQALRSKIAVRQASFFSPPLKLSKEKQLLMKGVFRKRGEGGGGGAECGKSPSDSARDASSWQHRPQADKREVERGRDVADV